MPGKMVFPGISDVIATSCYENGYDIERVFDARLVGNVRQWTMFSFQDNGRIVFRIIIKCKQACLGRKTPFSPSPLRKTDTNLL
jgi:hypothetical protein